MKMDKQKHNYCTFSIISSRERPIHSLHEQKSYKKKENVCIDVHKKKETQLFQ